MEDISADVVIIGAGVVGLAVAEAISKDLPELQILLLEKHRKFGQEISSHNSEVIHAGIYYEHAPLKARYCVQGNQALYTFCAEKQVPYRRSGKFIVASDESQLSVLGGIHATAKKNGADVEWVDEERLRALKNPSLLAALWSPNTGIVDSHSLMAALESVCISRGVWVSYGNEYVSCEDLGKSEIKLRIRQTKQDAEFCICTRVFINCAGLSSAKIAQSMLSEPKFLVKPCRGRYFSLSSKWNNQFDHLIYPTHDPRGGLGVHITFDLAGKCRLGPDVDWSLEGEEPDDFALYRFMENDVAAREIFYESGKKLIPELAFEDLQADYIGIRPKLFVDQQLNLDFVFHENKGGVLNLHLLGVESPGLTAALPIANDVSRSVKLALNLG